MDTRASFVSYHNVNILCLLRLTIKAAANRGIEQIGMQYYADGVLFPLAAAFIPASLLSEEFKKDRKNFNPKTDFDAMDAARPVFLSQFRSHLVGLQKAETVAMVQLSRLISLCPDGHGTTNSQVTHAVHSQHTWANRAGRGLLH